MERKVDLCIIGGAGSGLTAAICAKQAGVEDVLILEKMPNTGGCTVMSAGMFGVDTPAQHRQGYYYSADDMFADLIQLFNWNVDAMLVRKWINGSGENFRWLEQLGLKYDVAVTETADGRVFRNTMHRIAKWDGKRWCMTPQGWPLVRCLRENCEKLGVEILTNTRAKHLIQDESGAVVGVKAESPDGELIVNAGAVILCTGSISSNEQLIRRFYGTDEYKDVRIMAQVPHNTGDGLIMAEEIGAAPGKISTLFIGPQNHYADASEIIGMLMRRCHNIKVNILGERFCDESIPMYSEFGWMSSVAVDNQPGKVCYCIMDQDLMDKTIAGTDYYVPNLIDSLLDTPMVDKGGYFGSCTDSTKWREHLMEHIEYEQSKGRCKVCQTVAEMAEYIGCDEASLQATLDKYNLSCARGHDEDFLKNPNYLYPVAKAPFYVIEGKSGIDTCLGGLKIDNHQRVLRPDGHCIPGLYGAGVLTSGWVAGLYAVNGSEMSYTIFSGRNAAAEAANYISAKV